MPERSHRLDRGVVRTAAWTCLFLVGLVGVAGCGGGRGGSLSCAHGGRTYPANTTISEDACGLCLCTADGLARCTEHACPLGDASVGDDAEVSSDGADMDAGPGDAIATDADGAADGRHDGSQGGGVGAMCWSDSDCATPAFQPPPPSYCLAPDQSSTTNYGCPVCFTPPTTCATDGECASQGPTSICAVPGCSCSGTKTCLPGCATDADCATGQSCGTDHRCAASPCGPGAPACPTDFTCGAGQTCARRACTTDGECSGACVIGRCFDRAGTCTLPAA